MSGLIQYTCIKKERRQKKINVYVEKKKRKMKRRGERSEGDEGS
jgi:hypothetical protein